MAHFHLCFLFRVLLPAAFLAGTGAALREEKSAKCNLEDDQGEISS